MEWINFVDRMLLICSGQIFLWRAEKAVSLPGGMDPFSEHLNLDTGLYLMNLILPLSLYLRDSMLVWITEPRCMFQSWVEALKCSSVKPGSLLAKTHCTKVAVERGSPGHSSIDLHRYCIFFLKFIEPPVHMQGGLIFIAFCM